MQRTDIRLLFSNIEMCAEVRATGPRMEALSQKVDPQAQDPAYSHCFHALKPNG